MAIKFIFRDMFYRPCNSSLIVSDDTFSKSKVVNALDGGDIVLQREVKL